MGLKLSVIRMKFMEFEDTSFFLFMSEHETTTKIYQNQRLQRYMINMVNSIWFENLHCMHYYAHQHNLRYI